MSVSIVIPCYNEEAAIEGVITSCETLITSRLPGSEIIVVDDASSDSTPAILKRLSASMPALRVLTNVKNSGHGASILRGYRAAAHPYVFQMDSDGQVDADEFWKLYSAREGYDLCLGWRKKRLDPPSRLFLTRTIRLANRLVFGTDIRDANCPLRLMRREFLLKCLQFMDPGTLAPNIFISIAAASKRSLKEIEITHHARKKGGSRGLSWWLVSFAAKGLVQLLSAREKIRLAAAP